MFDPSPGRYSQLRKKLSEVKLLSRGCTILVEGPRVVGPCLCYTQSHAVKISSHSWKRWTRWGSPKLLNWPWVPLSSYIFSNACFA